MTIKVKNVLFQIPFADGKSQQKLGGIFYRKKYTLAMHFTVRRVRM